LAQAVAQQAKVLGELAPFRFGLGFHGAQEYAGIDQPVEPAVDGDPGCTQGHRGR